MSAAELKQFIEAIAITQRETASQIQDTDRQMKETDRKMQETDRLVKETSLQMKETDRKMQVTDRLVKETSLQMKETDRKLKELGKQIGGLGNKFGAFAEGLAFSSIERILRTDFGMESVTPRFSVVKGGESQEFDVLAFSNGEVNQGMIVEVKSSLDLATIEQMQRKMDSLFRWLPEHRNKEFQGMVAYVEGSAAARQAVLAQGWHLVQVGEDLFEVKTPPGFVPKIYRADQP
jgi:septal ring factor EnvC (AmiA/AmiB activator)